MIRINKNISWIGRTVVDLAAITGNVPLIWVGSGVVIRRKVAASIVTSCWMSISNRNQIWKFVSIIQRGVVGIAEDVCDVTAQEGKLYQSTKQQEEHYRIVGIRLLELIQKANLQYFLCLPKYKFVNFLKLPKVIGTVPVKALAPSIVAEAK